MTVSSQRLVKDAAVDGEREFFFRVRVGFLSFQPAKIVVSLIVLKVAV